MNKIVTALFHDRVTAETAYQSLITNGFAQQDISVLMSAATKEKEFGVVEKSKASEGAVVGAVAGGATVGTLAGVAAVATAMIPAIVVVPGVGLLVAGPLLAVLAGMGAGGVTGGIIGALVGAGIPEHEAKFLSKGLEKGGILIGVNVRKSEDKKLAETLLGRSGGESVKAA
jgi:hypothetical protein